MAAEMPNAGAAASISPDFLEQLAEMSEKRTRDIYDRLDHQAFERQKQHTLELALAAQEHQLVLQKALWAQVNEAKNRREVQERQAHEIQVTEETLRRKAAEDEQARRIKKQQIEEEQAKRAKAQAEARLRPLPDEEPGPSSSVSNPTPNNAPSQSKEPPAASQPSGTTLTSASYRNSPQPQHTPSQAPSSKAASRPQVNGFASPIPQPRTEAPSPKANGNLAKQKPPIQSQDSQRSTSGVIQPTLQPESGSGLPQHQTTHAAYLKLHQHLKDFRNDFSNRLKLTPGPKKQVGEWRREIRKFIGQLNGQKSSTLTVVAKTREILQAAKRTQGNSVDVRQFLVAPLPSTFNESQAQMPSLLIYLLNIFSKAIIAQFVDEAGVNTKTADPPGVVAISIFAHKDFQCQEVSLIDILLAKYHAHCPLLWGIYGSEGTEQGRARLGWKREDGNWVSEQRHHERMTGLGAGFAALSLRDFSKSKSANPYPHTNYWKAMANIINTPPQSITQSHLVALKAMLENPVAVTRFVGFYGQAAVAALRKAVVDYPNSAPSSAARSALSTMPDVIKKGARITL
ncbi:MAG: hypothetical protein M1828_001774 [Chrysothrix sp. TS-e1954]|nr:MAG: hypothetical protein M1828_001774 [Chrysothrix sp. TS-e1954]